MTVMDRAWTDKWMDDFADRVGRFEDDDMTNRTIWAGIFVAVMVKILFG